MKKHQKDTLGDRMKRYEAVSKTALMRRTPVIIRIDGKAFHTFTRGFAKPFDTNFMEVMQQTTNYLCRNIQNCVFGYTQSDEITLVLIDYKKLNTNCWFDNEVQKICSVSASMATYAFNVLWQSKVTTYVKLNELSEDEDVRRLCERYERSLMMPAMFDARCFNVPREEVVNNLLWRQQDAIRNSTNLLAQAYYSHKQLMGLKSDVVKNMLKNEKGVDWNETPISFQRGTAVYKNDEGMWINDYEMPIITEDRDFFEAFFAE